jgi:hypothetical protein
MKNPSGIEPAGAYKANGALAGAKDIAKVDLIKARLRVAAIPVCKDVRCDQITDPSTDGPSRRFFRFASEVFECVGVEIPVQIHEVVIGEHADDPIASASGW